MDSHRHELTQQRNFACQELGEEKENEETFRIAVQNDNTFAAEKTYPMTNQFSVARCREQLYSFISDFIH